MKRALLTISFLTILAHSGFVDGGLAVPPQPENAQVRSAPRPVGGPDENRPDDGPAVALLEGAGVPLQRDPSGHVRWIEATHGEFNDQTMRCLSGLPSLQWLEIGGGNISAAGILHLKGCPGLTRLYIHDIRLSDAALAVLGSLPRLEALSLPRTGVTGEAIRRLRTPDALRVLNLSDDEISDGDMTQMARFKNLEVLALQNTRVTGAGLDALEGMARLNVLNVGNCRIVDGDLKHFRSMPNLRIVHAVGCNFSDKALDDLKDKLPMLAIFQ